MTWCPPPETPPPEQNRKQAAGFCVAGSLANIKWRPIMLTGFLRQVLLNHFQAPNIQDPMLKDPAHPAIWQDAETTGILIESIHRWTGDLVEKRPAILVKRNAYRNLRVALNDRFGADGQGNEHYVTLWVGSHTLFCIHGTGASTEILATEAQQELTQFGPVIRQGLDLLRFQVTEVGPVSEVEESQQNFVVPITIGWAYTEAWKLELQARPVDTVVIKIEPRDV